MKQMVKHFSHQHPLILVDHAQEDVSCRGCNKSIVIGDSVYSCSTSNTSDDSYDGGCDNFFLHKTCAELPQELEYPMHQHHRLRLHPGGSCICNVCRDNDGWEWFTYACLTCEFDLCLTCALQDRRFDHKAHNHPLTLRPSQALFSCDACNTEAKDLSYYCTTCLFWIHQSCACAPTTLKCEFHKDHPLVLAYSLPEQYRNFDQSCSICKEKVHPSFWLYYCADCRFFAHIKCATSTETVQPSRSSENENISEVEELNLVHFPMPDETSLSSLIIHQFVKALSLADDSSRPADKRSHWSHPDHPLVLGDELKQSNTEIKYDEMLCDGCVQPLSVDAFYGCVQCNYFLHRFCTELPDELEVEHPSHPQHKLLVKKLKNPRAFFICDFCNRPCNGIFFGCESCDFHIDMVCASLPSKIKHESHEHPLNQLQIPRCDASEYRYSGFGFGCETCRFYLSKSSAIDMPRTVRHRWDPHPLRLMYPPVKGHPHEFDCEMCSKDINPNYWFYHCRDCDLSFHATCLKHVGCLLRGDAWSNIKFGTTVRLDDHQHSLTLVTNKRKWDLCNNGRLRHYIYFGEPVLECAPCEYLLCRYCIR